MNLTLDEERMLSGRDGPGVRRAMELLVAVGEAYDAEAMLDISYAHILPTQMLQYPLGQFGVWSRELVEESVEGAAGFKVPTTLNPVFIDAGVARKLGYPQTEYNEAEASMQHGRQLYRRLGIIPVYTCAPFLIYPIRGGEHVATAESGVVLLYNSVFGATVNRETGPTALAAALTGKTPLYGMHLPENRYGQVLVNLKDDLDPRGFTKTEYALLSYYIAPLAGDKIPVFSGIPENISLNDLRYLSASLSVSAGLPMMHAVGITPEAPSIELACGGRKPAATIDVGSDDIGKTLRALSTARDDKVELVLFGCPHLSLLEIREIAGMLEGKRIHQDVNLVVSTLEPLREIARAMGLLDIIEDAGGMVICGMCTACPFLRRQQPDGFALGNLATDSVKAAHLFGAAGVKLWLGDTRECINAAVSGKWEAQ